MSDWIEINKDDAHVKRERQKARELRKTAYFQELFRRGVCYYCGEKFPSEQLTLDHIVPLSRGGRSTRGNMVVCCRECNQEKKYLTPAEMILRELEQSGNTAENDTDNESNIENNSNSDQ